MLEAQASLSTPGALEGGRAPPPTSPHQAGPVDPRAPIGGQALCVSGEPVP